MNWSKNDIERARTTDLALVLAQQGFTLRELPANTFLVTEYRGLVIHGHNWLWKAHHLHGNTIDFFVVLLGHTFDEAMRVLCSRDRSGSSTQRSKPAMSQEDDDMS